MMPRPPTNGRTNDQRSNVRVTGSKNSNGRSSGQRELCTLSSAQPVVIFMFHAQSVLFNWTERGGRQCTQLAGVTRCRGPCSVFTALSYSDIILVLIFGINKKYVLWNAGICPIASKVGQVTLATPLFGFIHHRLYTTSSSGSNRENTKSLAQNRNPRWRTAAILDFQKSDF